MGDKSAQQPSNPEEGHISFGQMVRFYCHYYTSKYHAKLHIHVEK